MNLKLWHKKKVAAPVENRVLTSEEWFQTFGLAAGGVSVNEKTVMKVSAVYGATRLIAGSIASMPCHIYERKEAGRARANHDLWWLLNEEPNSMYSAATFWEYLVTGKLLQGDAFAKILRKSKYSPDIKGFEALHPQAVEVIKDNGRLIYHIRRDGETGVEKLDQDDMIHVPNFGFDGLRGLSTLRSSLLSAAGIALAADQYSAEFFENSARPDIALIYKGTSKPSPASLDLIREGFAKRHSGLGNRHLPALLQGEFDIKTITMNADDAQLLQTRVFQIEEIIRIFGVPPHMIGHNEKTTSWGSGIEQLGIAFVKHTLLPHCIKFQQEINRKCFRTERFFAEFNPAALERGDLKSRAEAHRVGLGRAGEPGWVTVNEIRRLENMMPIEGGDTLNTGDKNAAADDKTSGR